MAVSRSRRWSGGDSVAQQGRNRHARRPSRESVETIPREDAAAASAATRIAAELAEQVLVATGAETASHSRAVEHLALHIADRLGLSGEEREAVGVAARLHDIGKVGIPRPLLEKSGPLTGKEWELIYTHTIIGERILRSVAELDAVASLVRHSHERWDGTGYPDGLEGDQIPQASRIIFCADAFHAICSDRPYSPGRSTAAALAEIRRCAGTQFEPLVVEALTDVVRTRLYAARRVRRRSHGRVSVMMISALLLGGSIAGGMAASRDDSGVPGQGPTAAAPLLRGGLELTQDASAKGGVAGVFAGAKLGATESAPSQVPAAPEQPAEASTPKPHRLTETSTGTVPSISLPELPEPSVRVRPGITGKLGLGPQGGDDTEGGSDGGDLGTGEPSSDPPRGDDPSVDIRFD